MGCDLIKLADYKKYVGITSNNQDTIIEILIPRISQFVKTYCNRTFADFTYDPKVEVLEGNSSRLILAETPVIEIVSVEYSNDYGQTYSALTEFTDWVLDGDYILPIGVDSFPKAIRGYKITYKAGYDPLPEDLVQAIMDLVTYYRKNDGGVNTTKFSNTTNMQIEYISGQALPAYIKRILDQYILEYI